MAVHSQLPQQQFQMAVALCSASAGCGASQAATLVLQQVVPPAMFSELESDLTWTISDSRKRPRYEPPSPTGVLFQQKQQHMNQKFVLQRQQMVLLDQIHRTTHATSGLNVESSRLFEAAMVSTSGRPPFVAAPPEQVTLAACPGYNDTIDTTNASGSSSGLVPMLRYHSPHVDALVGLRAERLRSSLEVACKRHCRALIAAMEQQAQQRVAEKQAELEAAAKRNAELEERLRQATVESQAWFDVARNSEALVARLRATLEQALLQQQSGKNINNGDCASGNDLCGDAEEGYGDSEEEPASAAASTAVTSSIPCAEASTAEMVTGGRWGSSDAFLGCR